MEKRALSFLDEDIVNLEEQIKKLCGGRVCKKSKSGKQVFRTETYDPPLWYFEDGRLAPKSDWPR